MFRWFTGGASSLKTPPVFGSLEINTQATQVNDSLYELHRPLIPPNVQIVLFHGLQKEDYSEAHLSTWLSEDGSCIWPKMWLAEAIPGVHVFSARYSGDMYIIGENLLSDLVHGGIGQKSHCPVVLVGHSIGGLVIKQLCQQAHHQLHISQGSEKAKYEAFLSNLKGIFCFSTPHHGSQVAKTLGKRIPGPLFSYFEALSKDSARLNHEFEGLCKVRDSLLIAGLSEGLPTTWGPLGNFFQDFLVPEASARTGDFNVVNDADHFSICRPRNKSSRSFHKLKDFVCSIVKDAQEAKEREDVRLQEERIALENLRPDNFQYVPKYAIGLDCLVQAIKAKLDNVRTLGLVGMGGLGKTTLAKEVFNSLAANFEYTCFSPIVKLIVGNEKAAIDEIVAEMHRRGKKIRKEDRDVGWRSKPLLLVLDDCYGERDENVLSELEGTIGQDSRIIFTSRNQHPMGYSGEIYRVALLESACAEKLFLSCAFPDLKIPSTKLESIINAIVQKCEGLPLAIVVLGKFLGARESYEEWEQTLGTLDRAQDVTDINERLWAKLRPSYDSLEEKLQQIFLDAATFFRVKGWTLQEAKGVWRVAYDTRVESLLWRKLVDLSLVYDVKEDEPIRMHEQLQSMGRMIASGSINNTKRREWDGDDGLTILHSKEDSNKEGIFALRIGRPFDYWSGNRICISSDTFSRLKNLRYLEVNSYNGRPVDIARHCLPFQAPLCLLDCHVPDLAHVLLHPGLQDHIVILRVSWKKSRLPAYIASFSKLRSLTFYSAPLLKTIPNRLANLSQLKFLQLIDCHSLQTLPESFGSLLALNRLDLHHCGQLKTLPETFGSLSALNRLEVWHCDQLQTLPESFGSLSALNFLTVNYCDQLQTLPDSFGNLSALNHLSIISCKQLHALPGSFGRLSSLSYLDLVNCEQLQTLPQSFGRLSALQHLAFACHQLHTLPESFGSLDALHHLGFYNCRRLQTLPESFGTLSALSHLEFRRCEQLQILPNSFGNLSALNHLIFLDCTKLLTLPNSFRNLTALQYLEFSRCDNLKTLPVFLRGALPIDPANIIFRQRRFPHQEKYLRHQEGTRLRAEASEQENGEGEGNVAGNHGDAEKNSAG